jgi:hypothetical protein
VLGVVGEKRVAKLEHCEDALVGDRVEDGAVLSQSSLAKHFHSRACYGQA